jgi:hypothetical protein
MSTDPQFASTPVIGQTRIATANTNRDGTGTIANLVTGGASGTRVSRVKAKATGTTTAGVIRIYVKDNSTNIRILDEILVAAVTPSATVESWEGEITFSDMNLPSGWSLQVSTHNAEQFDVHAFGGNY